MFECQPLDGDGHERFRLWSTTESSTIDSQRENIYTVDEHKSNAISRGRTKDEPTPVVGCISSFLCRLPIADTLD